MTFGRLERPQASRPMSEINMTPLIDVMLVLLVIFIIAAPLLASSLKLDLPKTDAARPGDGAASIPVAVDAAGQLYLAEQPLADAEFVLQIAEAARRSPQAEVMLRADQAVPYGRVAELIGMLQNAGLVRIGFVAEAPRLPPR